MFILDSSHMWWVIFLCKQKSFIFLLPDKRSWQRSLNFKVSIHISSWKIGNKDVLKFNAHFLVISCMSHCRDYTNGQSKSKNMFFSELLLNRCLSLQYIYSFPSAFHLWYLLEKEGRKNIVNVTNYQCDSVWIYSASGNYSWCFICSTFIMLRDYSKINYIYFHHQIAA